MPTEGKSLSLVALSSIGEITEGNDLAAVLSPLLLATGEPIDSHSVLVIAQKIVSKAEGRSVFLDEVRPSPRALEIAAVTGKDPALVEMVLSESCAVLRVRPNVLIVRHRLGFVVANAGIDQSNVPSPGGRMACLLLPRDPQGSAESIRGRLGRVLGCAPAVVISDSFGRPWRRGVVNIALGSSGLCALHNCRGELDREGRALQVTEVAIADAVAAAAGLLMGEANQSSPAVLIKGGNWATPEVSAIDIIRPPEEDLFT